jgi:hypothetical protein
MKFYLDGALGQEVSYTRGPGARTSFTISVGGTVGNQNNIFTGTMDRIRVSKGALDPVQFDYPISTALSIQRSGNNNLISWPLAAGNVVLQKATVLSPSSITWSDVSSTLTTNGTVVSTSVPLTGPTEFYRLRPGP